MKSIALSELRLLQLLSGISNVRLIVCGDYYLDNYLILDRELSEPSLETGLEAYQVVATRKLPGVAGTVTSNLRALGVKVTAIGIVGEDGHGFELRRKLEQSGVDACGLVLVPGMDTPTYLKPMMRELDGHEHELNRMDVRPRQPTSAAIEALLIEQIELLLPGADGMLVIDQSARPDCGTITAGIRAELAHLASTNPHKLLLADSRNFPGLFHRVRLKCNLSEAQRATGLHRSDGVSDIQFADRCARLLFAVSGQPVVITLGGEGMFLLDDSNHKGVHLPAIPVKGPLDIVGAGDCVDATLGAALCAGASLAEAGWLANLAASIVIQQIGTTGTASPEQVLARFREYINPPN